MSRAPSRIARDAPAVSPPTSWRRHLPLAVACVVFLLAGFFLFTSTGRDDAHITYWPAYTLSHYGQMLNYNGERVEQSSSLLHVVMLGIVAAATGVDVPTLGKLSSILAGLSTLALIFIMVRRLAGASAAFASTMLVALSAYFVYWSFGGLETTIVCLCGVWLILVTSDYLAGRVRIAHAALCVLAFVTVRPETPFLLLAFLFATLILALLDKTADSAAARRRALLLLATGAAACAAVCAFRLLYFGRLVPQPVEAKYVGLTLESLANGWHYFVDAVINHGVVIAIAITAGLLACLTIAIDDVRARRFLSHRLIAVLYVAAYVGFTLTSGGDWMEAGRFFVFFLPVALALIPVAWSDNTLDLPRATVALLAVLVVAEFIALLAFARAESAGTLRWRELEVAQQHDVSRYSWFEKRNRVNMRDIPIIDTLGGLILEIERQRRGPVVLMTGQMGMIAYHLSTQYFGRVHFIDRRGLCDRRFTECAAARMFRRDSRGMHVEYQEYFHAQAMLNDTCGLPAPEVIFDLRGGNTQIVSENGYNIVARQYGSIGDPSEGGEVQATGFVALRKDVWKSITGSEDPPPRTPQKPSGE